MAVILLTWNTLHRKWQINVFLSNDRKQKVNQKFYALVTVDY